VKDTRQSNAPRKVFIVDDHPMMRIGLSHFLKQAGDIKVCGEASDAAGALAGIERIHPDLVLLDISLEGRSGLDLLRDLRIRFPRLPVLVHSMHDELIYADRALAAGARGYLMKQEGGEKLRLAVREVLCGQIYLSDRVRARDPAQAGRATGRAVITRFGSLSQREFEVFGLIGRGVTNQLIARQLHISLKTVEAHREHIKRKLGVQSSTALNLLAVRWESTRSGYSASNASADYSSIWPPS
jgi:DNA-binding NarL/FixJ family response regulator